MKCRQCGKEITKENAIQIKTRLYACSEKCKQDYEKAHAPQDNVDNGRKMLFDYIKTVAPDVNFRLVGIQLANLMKEYPDMTYNGIAYTIKYIKNYLGLDVSETPLGLVKYKYDEAHRYWQWRTTAKKSIKNTPISDDEQTIQHSNRGDLDNVFV